MRVFLPTLHFTGSDMVSLNCEFYLFIVLMNMKMTLSKLYIRGKLMHTLKSQYVKADETLVHRRK